MQDEQKKVAILGVLGVVILGVGVFQFRSMDAPAPATPAASSTKRAVATVDPQPATPPLPPLSEDRDPFSSPVATNGPEPAKFVGSPLPDASAAQPDKSSKLEPQPPFMAMKGDILPVATGAGASQPPSQASKAPVVPPTPPFAYKLGGVMLGAKSLAVFVDETGGQRLVGVGAAIDPDSKLVSVTNTGAVVNYRGKRLRIALGGDPRAK
jgi:hypothetical protein